MNNREFNVIINLKNGKKDELDPLFRMCKFQDKFIIDNGFYEYDYFLDDIKNIEFKEIL